MRLADLAVLVVASLPAPAAAASGCQEDMRCWNWRTMGNGSRGVDTLGGRHKVVTAAQFDRLNRARRIDWAASPRLRGDGRRY